MRKQTSRSTAIENGARKRQKMKLERKDDRQDIEFMPDSLFRKDEKTVDGHKPPFTKTKDV